MQKAKLGKTVELKDRYASQLLPSLKPNSNKNEIDLKSRPDFKFKKSDSPILSSNLVLSMELSKSPMKKSPKRPDKLEVHFNFGQVPDYLQKRDNMEKIKKRNAEFAQLIE